MLGSAFATLPVKDQQAAAKFYEGILGLEKLQESPGGTFYQTGSSKIFVYPSTYAGTNKATAAAWEVDDVEETVETLSGKGVLFEEYDGIPGVTRKGKIHTLDAESAKAAWFIDPSGNILSISTPAAD